MVVSGKITGFGVSDALTTVGLVSAWILNNSKSFDDYNKYLEKFDDVMTQYNAILEANEE